MLISQTADACQIAVTNNKKLQDFFVEKSSQKSLVGSIYTGTVVRVLAGLQAVFVDIGEARTAFLHKDDTLFLNRPIERCFYQGEKVLVQVIKDPIGDKGARLSTDIALSSTFLVYRPYAKDGVGVSQKIKEPAQRDRLADLLSESKNQQGITGKIITRTQAKKVCQTKLHQDMNALYVCWQGILTNKTAAKKPALLYRLPPLAVQCVQNFADKIDTIITDSKAVFDELQTVIVQSNPKLISKLALYTGNTPLFSESLKGELKTVMSRKIPLTSGGYLVIDETEAMVVIDVNTGSFIGKKSLEQTAYDVNIEASDVIARIARLRNLGGIIVVDFVDMNSKANKQKVVDCLKNAFKDDIAETHILPMSELGLVQMTRKRTSWRLTDIRYTPLNS